MEPNAAREWGIWYAGGYYTVGHFLKTLGPESVVVRFPTKQDAETAIVGRHYSSVYEARMIPAVKPLPEKN